MLFNAYSRKTGNIRRVCGGGHAGFKLGLENKVAYGCAGLNYYRNVSLSQITRDIKNSSGTNITFAVISVCGNIISVGRARGGTA